jgi:DNA-binding NarL/FixJ family response regulator
LVVLSQNVEQLYARELLADNASGVGYLLKDRVFNDDQFVDAIRAVAAGGTVMDPEVVTSLLVHRARRDPSQAVSERARSARADGRGTL